MDMEYVPFVIVAVLVLSTLTVLASLGYWAHVRSESQQRACSAQHCDVGLPNVVGELCICIGSTPR
jgi:hypothetical protein